MPKLTLLSRISDGLPLAASMEDEKDHRELDGYKAQAKKLLKTMSNGTPARVSVESGGSVFQCARASDTPQHSPQGRTCLTKPATAPACRSYINQEGVCYMCLTEKSYPKRCAPGSCTAALAHPTHRRLCPSLPRRAHEASEARHAGYHPRQRRAACGGYTHSTRPHSTPLALSRRVRAAG